MPSSGWTRTIQGCAVVAALCVSGVRIESQAPPQNPPPQAPSPVFRGGVNFVSVDAYPRRDGKLVEGLRAGDFQILEDGRLQTVEKFEYIAIEPNPVDADRRDPSSQAEGDRLARDPRNRVFVVYLDYAHTTRAGSVYAKQPLVDFLTRTIGATDVFGFMTADLPVGQLAFGRRTEAIEGQLEKYLAWGQADVLFVEPRTPVEEQLRNCEAQLGLPVGALIRLHREDSLQSSLENLVVRLRDLRDERKNILFISEGWVPRGPNPGLGNVSLGRGAPPTVGVGPGGRIGIGQSMDPMNRAAAAPWCDQAISRLANQDYEKRFRDLLTQARQANVSFYPVDVGGLRVESSIAGARSTLMTLAENTDGFAITNTNDLQAGVRRITADLSAFYLLGYYSTNTANDGRYRRIEVKVAQPRIEVTARRGYLAPTAAIATAATAVPTGPTAVDDALGKLSVIRESTALLVHGTASASSLGVVVEIASAAMTRGWQRGAEVRVTVAGALGPPVTATATIVAGERSTHLTVPLDPASRGPWRVSVHAEGPDGPVDERTDVTLSTAALVGMPSAWRGTPSPRVPLKPVADFRLTRAERLRVEWPVLAESETRTARLLDRRGQALGAALPFVALPPDRQALAIDLPVSALPEGDYVIELVVAKAETNERRLLAFRVVR
jgi:VWFA-related protein